MKSKLILCMAMAFLAVLCISPRAYGQATASFSGTVTDKSGSVIPGATVTATSQETGQTRTSTTDATGHYAINLLPIGNYTLRVESSGFQAAVQKDVRLQVDEQRELDFAMSPATVSSEVVVNATEVAVQTTNGSLGQVINSQQVAELPLNGRDFVQLANLTPGTIQETNPNSFFTTGGSSEVAARGSFSLSVGGSRANSTDWLLDGNDNNELTAGGIAILPSIDAIQEFKVLTYDYSAQWGTRAGPTVLVTTKSGSNQFHGSLFEFLRNTKLDARSYFATSTEKFNLNQYGGSLGGPIQKDKTFFFIDLEQKNQRQGIVLPGLVPTQAMRTGDFTSDVFGNVRDVGGLPAPNAPPGQTIFPPSIINPNMTGAPNVYFQCDSSGNPLPSNPDGSQPAGADCNKIPSGLINPITQQMINFYPLPNANNQSSGFNYVGEPVRKLNEKKFDVKLDHTFSPADTLMARFSYDQANSYVPGGAPGFAEANAFASNQGIINHGRNAVVSETHIFSPNTVNQFTGGYSRIFNYITSQGTGSCESTILGIPGGNLDCGTGNKCAPGGVSCGLTSTQLSGGYYAIGDRGYSPFQGGTNVFSIFDSLDLVRGRHDIKIGGSIRANQMNVRTEAFQDGYWIYTGAWTSEPEADLLLGLPSLAIHDQTFNGATIGRRWKTYRPYIEDDWRVTNNLTLNLGLAWALTTPIGEAHNRQANFNPANGQFLIAGQNAGSSAGVMMDKTGLEPRIGVAWKPFSSDKTVIRGGYAIVHDNSWNQGSEGLWQNPPYFAESDFFGFGGGCTFATSACATTYGKTPGAQSASAGFLTFTSPPNPASFTGTLQAQNINPKLGRVQQYNVDVERQIPGQVVLTVGYVGSRSSHILTDGNNLNVGSPAACGTVSGYTMGCGPGGAPFGVPYPAFPFSTVSDIMDIGSAHYNALQVKAETKSSRYGIYALIGYTYSRNYDNGYSDGIGTSIGATYFPLPNWQSLDWGLSQVNLNQDFTASIVYQLPFGQGKHFGNDWNGPLNVIAGGWEVAVIQKITSGFPIFIVDSANTSGVNFENNGNSLMRPDQTCGAKMSNPTLGQWFNTACFAQPSGGELGDAGRTPALGPDFVNTDFSLIKHFQLPREGMGLDFRSEFFNLFNHPQFGLPSADFNSPGTFGKISSTVNNARLIQFGLKFHF